MFLLEGLIIVYYSGINIMEYRLCFLLIQNEKKIRDGIYYIQLEV
jgi:hypothetical protein